MRKIYYFLFLIPLITGCQPQKEVIHERVVEKNLPTPPKDQFGGGDTGGGAGRDGRPLEDFIVNIQEDEDFRTILMPLILKIDKIHSRLAADLLHISKERSWFKIDVSLEKIPAFKMGVYFPTDQMALQNKKEVWIDNLIFTKMTSQNRAKLLLHELIMGIRLLEFASPLDLCLAKATTGLLPSGKDDYKENRKKCFDDPDNAFDPNYGHKISLEDIDYANIRKLTKMLFENSNDLTKEEIETFLKVNNFRKY